VPSSGSPHWLDRLRDPQWLHEGKQPDYRFSLANERTFLAWIRTVLGLLAAAVGVSQLIPAHKLGWGRHVIALVLAGVAVVAAANTYRRWAANERAMRNGESLPPTSLLVLLALSLTLVGVGVVVLVVAW
jgi:putative membrane protein